MCDKIFSIEFITETAEVFVSEIKSQKWDKINNERNLILLKRSKIRREKDKYLIYHFGCITCRYMHTYCA